MNSRRSPSLADHLPNGREQSTIEKFSRCCTLQLLQTMANHRLRFARAFLINWLANRWLIAFALRVAAVSPRGIHGYPESLVAHVRGEVVFSHSGNAW